MCFAVCPGVRVFDRRGREGLIRNPAVALPRQVRQSLVGCRGSLPLDRLETLCAMIRSIVRGRSAGRRLMRCRGGCGASPRQVGKHCRALDFQEHLHRVAEIPRSLARSGLVVRSGVS